MEPDVTQLLKRVAEGDAGATERLVGLVYRQLHSLARGAMAAEAGGHTLQPTALVHEAWLRMFPGESAGSWESRNHFFNVAARAMRNVLVDHARGKRTQKRGEGRRPAPLDLWIGVLEKQSVDVLALHDALSRLEAMDAPLARLVELRFFAGLSIPETARVLGVSESTVERGWRTARAWLRGKLGAE